jgi:hypothetical protein
MATAPKQAPATVKQLPATTNKESPVTAPAKAAMDFSKMSVEEMLGLSKQLQEAAVAQSQKEFDSTINFLNEKLTKMGRTKADAANALITLMSDEERAAFRKSGSGPAKKRVARGTKQEREYKDKDSTGARPEVGKTYALPKDPKTTWTKSAQGAVKKEFLAAVQGGAKWVDMAVKK